MAVLVIFVFMRDWRSTLITALALPTSVIATFFFMYAVGFTINMMTLMALSLVIGILIDDAVVVRESIYRHMEHGEDPVTAARNGTSEIGLAVMATTFTILAVFLPVGFMTGIVGQFFKSFALTIAFAVSMSLLVAFTLDPMLSSRFVRFIPLEERMRTRTGRFLERVGHFYDRIDVQYHRLLGWAVEPSVEDRRHRRRGLRREPVDAVGDRHRVRPVEDRGEFVVNIEAPPGTSFEETVAHVVEVENGREEHAGSAADLLDRRLRRQPAEGVAARQGRQEGRARARPRGAQGRHARAAQADSAAEDDGGGSGVHAGIADAGAAQRLSARRRHGRAAAPQRRGPGEGEGGARRRRRRQHARNRPARNGGERQSSSWPPTSASTCGSVAMQLRGMVEGIVPTRLREDDKEYDIRVRLAPEFRNDFEAISRTPLYSPTGAVVRTRDIVTMQPEVGPATIEREQRRRQAKIDIELADRSARRRHGRRRQGDGRASRCRRTSNGASPATSR